jgi:hypothetical protein
LQALPPAVTSHAQKLVDIEDELRKLERLHAAKISRARGSDDEESHFFYRMLTGAALPTIDSTYVQDEPHVQRLVEQLRFYQNYKIKDLNDGAILSFHEALLLDGSLFMMMKSGADAPLRAYKLETKDSDGRDVFKNATEAERQAIHHAEKSFGSRTVFTDGTAVRMPQRMTPAVATGARGSAGPLQQAPSAA